MPRCMLLDHMKAKSDALNCLSKTNWADNQKITKLFVTMNTVYAMSQKDSCMCFVETVKILIEDAKKSKKATNFDILQNILKNTVLDALQGRDEAKVKAVLDGLQIKSSVSVNDTAELITVAISKAKEESISSIACATVDAVVQTDIIAKPLSKSTGIQVRSSSGGAECEESRISQIIARTEFLQLLPGWKSQRSERKVRMIHEGPAEKSQCENKKFNDSAIADLSNSIDLEEFETGSEISSTESETEEIEASLRKKYLRKQRI